MGLSCTMGQHFAVRDEVYNGGFWFSACRSCGAGLFRTARRPWAPPPRGHRIAWKAGRQSHSIEPDFADLLPVPVPTQKLPARRSRWMSWCRELVRGRPRRLTVSARGGACTLEEEGDYRHPALALAGALLAAALTLAWDVVAAR